MKQDGLIICTRCVMDTTSPEIEFDEKGVCSFCREAEGKLKRSWFPSEEGKRKLMAIAEEIKEYGKDKEYDCIVGVSGGVDSSYLLYVAKRLMGLRPLVVHVDAGWNSEIAVKNIENLVKALGLDLFTYVVDWEEMRDLQLAFLKAAVVNQDTPQDHVFFAKLYDFAVKNKVKYVLNGSNLTSESILPASWGYSASDKKHIMAIYKRFGSGKLRTFPTMGFFKQKIYWPYIRKMKRVAPLNFLNYDKAEAMDFLMKNYGWRDYGGKHHESKWTKFFQSYYLPRKFGFDKRKAHLSSLIVAGQISRKDAMQELSKDLYDEREVEEDIGFIAKKLNITIPEFKSLIELPPKHYSEYPNSERGYKLGSRLKRLVRGGK